MEGLKLPYTHTCTTITVPSTFPYRYRYRVQTHPANCHTRHSNDTHLQQFVYKKKKMALEVFKKIVRVSFEKGRGSLKKNKMKEKEAEKVFWLAMEEQDPMFYSAAMAMERKEYKAWERRTCSTQQPWPLS